MRLSDDGQYLLIGLGIGRLKIYKDDGKEFLSFQTISDSSSKVEAVAMAPDSKTLATGTLDSKIRIYTLLDGAFTLSQTISESYNISEVHISHSHLLYSGHSNEITFLQRIGPDFEFEQTVSTGETRVEEVGISGDFDTLSYGYTSQTLNILVNANGTFTPEFSYYLGSTIRSVKMDEEGLYYFVIADDQKLHTFYHCPTGCADCSFPNNCSVCEGDYILKGAYCFPKPTRCVGNVVLKGNVC